MRKITLILVLTVLVIAVGGAIYYMRAQQPEPFTIQVDGKTIVLKPGENVAPEFYEPARTNPEWLATVEWVVIEGKWEPLAKGVPLPLDVQQVILPEGHPEFPAETVWVVIEGEEGPIEVPVPLDIPAGWAGKYETRVDGNVAYCVYTVNPDRKETIFSVAALTEARWEAMQDEPHGEALLAYGGIVWVYNPALDNAYSGSQAEEFQQMVGEAYRISRNLATFLTPAVPAEAEQALAAARRTLSDALGVPEAQVTPLVIEHQDWSDACLGLAHPDEVCAAVITPGWRMVLDVGGDRVNVHTDEAGTNLRWE